MQQQQYQGPDRRQSQTQYQGDDRRKPDPVIDDPILTPADANRRMSTQERKDEQERIRQQQVRHDDTH
jgi:hypothetical protein